MRHGRVDKKMTLYIHIYKGAAQVQAYKFTPSPCPFSGFLSRSLHRNDHGSHEPIQVKSLLINLEAEPAIRPQWHFSTFQMAIANPPRVVTKTRHPIPTHRLPMIASRTPHPPQLQLQRQNAPLPNTAKRGAVVWHSGYSPTLPPRGIKVQPGRPY
jgi:hypothetical protein